MVRSKRVKATMEQLEEDFREGFQIFAVVQTPSLPVANENVIRAMLPEARLG